MKGSDRRSNRIQELSAEHHSISDRILRNQLALFATAYIQLSNAKDFVNTKYIDDGLAFVNTTHVSVAYQQAIGLVIATPPTSVAFLGVSVVIKPCYITAMQMSRMKNP